MICGKCNKERIIVNKRHKLCDYCNHIRLHGKNWWQTFKEKRNAKRKPLSEKGKKYIEVLRKIDKERGHVCSGCGLKGVVLSHSHIISQKDCKNYGFESLIYDEKNIAFHCIGMYNDNDCHKRWENPTKRKELLDYEKNMEYIKSISIELYNKYL